MQNIPVHFDGEYRGLARLAGEFEGTNRDSGAKETVSFTESLNFEFESVDGVTDTIAIRAADLDKATPAVDYKAFVKGDRATIVGHVSLADRNSGKDSYFVVRSVVPITGSAAKKQPAV